MRIAVRVVPRSSRNEVSQEGEMFNMSHPQFSGSALLRSTQPCGAQQRTSNIFGIAPAISLAFVVYLPG